MEQQQAFEPMSVGRILDKTFQIYRNNFIRFVTIVALIQVPFALLNLAFTSILVTPAPTVTPGAAEIQPAAVFGIGITALLAMIGGMLCQAALIKSVSESYLNREISVGQAYRGVLPKLLTLLGASPLVGLVVMLGFILLVVPGVIFSLWLYLTIPCIIVEDLGAGAGMSRSKTLTSGNLGKVFLVALLVLLITWVISIPLGIVGAVLSHLVPEDVAVLKAFVETFINVIAQILAMPIGASAAILLYYDLRIRKAGYDLEMLSQSFSASGDVADAGQG